MHKTHAKPLYLYDILKFNYDSKKNFNIEELGEINIPLSLFSVIKIPRFSGGKILHCFIKKYFYIYKKLEIS